MSKVPKDECISDAVVFFYFFILLNLNQLYAGNSSLCYFYSALHNKQQHEKCLQVAQNVSSIMVPCFCNYKSLLALRNPLKDKKYCK